MHAVYNFHLSSFITITTSTTNINIITSVHTRPKEMISDILR